MRPFEAPGELREEMKEIVWLCFLKKEKTKRKKKKKKKERKKNSTLPQRIF